MQYGRLALLALCAILGPVTAAPPEGVTLPLLVWSIDFNDNPLGVAPQGLNKAQLEAQAQQSAWQRLPIRTYRTLEHVTATRVATVVPEAAGLKDQPLLFTYSENAQPHYGPKLSFAVPDEVARAGALWRLSLDVAKGNIAISGGVHLWDIGGIEFFEDGTVRVGATQVGRYAANKPLHLDCQIDAVAKTFTVTLDGDQERAVTAPWRSVKAESFHVLILHGLLPGGHAEAPGSIAFDNIKLLLEKTK